MIETKVRLSMSIPGAQMLSEQECSENPKENYQQETITVKYKKKKGKIQKENIVINLRKNRLVKQVLNISKEAYDYMTDPKLPPTDKLARKLYLQKTDKIKGKKITVETTVWANLSPMRKLDWHLANIAKSLGAVDYTFTVLDD